MQRHTLLTWALSLSLTLGQSVGRAQGVANGEGALPFVRVPSVHSITFTSPAPTLLQTNTLMSVALEQQGELRLSFDLLEDNTRLLGYRLRHYNADWSPSVLTSSEVIQGFVEGELEAPLPSHATLTPYQHYRLVLRPEMLRFRVSGNYLLSIYDLDNPEQDLLALPLLVCERYGSNKLSISETSWQGHSTTQQYISSRIDREHLPTATPEQWLSVYLLQNGQWSGMQRFVSASSVTPDAVVYALAQAIPFAGGNEYLRIEHLDDYAATLGLTRLERTEHRIIAETAPQRIDSLAPYIYTPDLDGKQIIRSITSRDLDTEVDYHWVNFVLNGNAVEDTILLEGEAFDLLPESARTLRYDEASKRYSLLFPLKVGYQEYRFVRKVTGTDVGKSMPLTGSHAQTTNTYTALVYLRTPSDRADRLLDITQLRYQP